MKLEACWLKLVVILVAAALPGCAGIPNGAQSVTSATGESAERTERLTAIRQRIQSDCRDLSFKAGSDDRARRNDIVSAYVFTIDEEYNTFEGQLGEAIRSNNLGAAEASLGLSTLGGILRDAQIIRALAGANSIIAGTAVAISRDYLFSQTLPVLLTQMQASRERQRAVILNRQRLAYADWTICTALSDVLAFERAGTLNAALIAVAESAAQANAAAVRQVANAIPTAEHATSTTAEALRAYFDVEGAVGDARVARAHQALNSLGIGPQGAQTAGARLSDIVEEAPFENERRQLISALVIVERPIDASAADALAASLQP